MTYLILFGFSIIAWALSVIGAGGAAIMMVPVILFLVGSQAIPQILSINSIVSAPYRLFLFRKNIDWNIVKWSFPAVILGPFLGAYTFTVTQPEIFQLILGLFLIIYVTQDIFLKKSIKFNAKNWHFLPAHLIAGFISGLIGAVGPIMNILYLQKDISKEAIVGTKSANVIVSNIVKFSTYAYFGSINNEIITYGITAGLGGIIGITIGKRLLNKLSYTQFKKIVLFLMFVSGVIICLKGIGFYLT